MECIGGRCVRRDCPKCTVWTAIVAFLAGISARNASAEDVFPSDGRECTFGTVAGVYPVERWDWIVKAEDACRSAAAHAKFPTMAVAFRVRN